MERNETGKKIPKEIFNFFLSIYRWILVDVNLALYNETMRRSFKYIAFFFPLRGTSSFTTGLYLFFENLPTKMIGNSVAPRTSVPETIVAQLIYLLLKVFNYRRRATRRLQTTLRRRGRERRKNDKKKHKEKKKSLQRGDETLSREFLPNTANNRKNELIQISIS